MESLVKEGSICAVLFKSQIISEDDIRAALEEQKRSGCRIGEALVRLEIVAQEDIDWALSNQLNIPYVRLTKETIDQAAVELVPAALARKFNLIPIYRSGDEITIALADPLNSAAVAAVGEATGCRVTVAMPIIRELREMQDHFYGPVPAANSFGFSSPRCPADILEKINKDLSGGAFINFILLYMIRNRLASLSLQPMGDTVTATAKQDEGSQEIGRLKTDYYPDLLQRLSSLARLKRGDTPSTSGTLEFLCKGEKVQFQLFVLKGKAGEFVTLKMPKQLPFPEKIEELTLSADKIQSFRELAAVGQGMVLFCSDDRDECCRLIDLYLDEADTAHKTVMVLGDGPGRGRKRFPAISLQKALPAEMESIGEALLDHDPDILVVEDISVGWAAKTASRAAMAGRLAVCGLTCGNTANALDYLRYAGHRYPLHASLKGMLCIKGVRLLCPLCKENRLPADEAGAPLPGSPPLFVPRGCPACGRTGYQGKKHLLEIIPVNGEIAAFLETAGESGEILRQLREKGHRGIREEAQELLTNGEISAEEYAALYGES